MAETGKLKLYIRLYTLCFLAAEGLFYLLFLSCDLFEQEILFSSTSWKFAVIVLALFYVALEFLFTKRQDALWLRRLFLLFAMILTLVSDVFLLVQDKNYVIGVCTFFLAQVFHALEIPRSKKQAIVSFSLRFGATAAAIAVLSIVGKLTPLYTAVALYAPQLLGNFLEHVTGIFKFREREEKMRSFLLAVGFLLFVGCDICVGLSNLGVHGVSFWIWAFYAPSQALIAISCGRFYHEKTTD
ncbi:MAG: hypothetical protein IJR88_05945 [Clostridia bacterium]|nr:hypothetical protein [Clostridia bacterium]